MKMLIGYEWNAIFFKILITIQIGLISFAGILKLTYFVLGTNPIEILKDQISYFV